MLISLPLEQLLLFSSRRRHTRWPRDWSSDVCSSDLVSDLGPGHALGAGVSDGDLDGLFQYRTEHAEVVEAGLGVGESRIAQTPTKGVHVVEGGGVGAHQRSPPITAATAARWRGVRGVRDRRSRRG